ncbi:MAG: hypothetical protein LQ351_000665 [Letrouitia transgressa]|nr:MAG: hypothetical protein LQ351_000665 [Letrouitia transgressa]
MADQPKEELHVSDTPESQEAKRAEAAQDSQEEQASKPPREPGSAFLGSYGNAAGSTIQSGLAPVGKPLGKGLETVASPVGGLVEPLVGGIMKSGSAFGENFGTGAGNMDQKKKAEMEQARWVTSQAWANELFV